MTSLSEVITTISEGNNEHNKDDNTKSQKSTNESTNNESMHVRNNASKLQNNETIVEEKNIKEDHSTRTHLFVLN